MERPLCLIVNPAAGNGRSRTALRYATAALDQVRAEHRVIESTSLAHARDLASSAAHLSRRLATEAESAAKDPSGTAKKAARRVARELDDAAKEIDKILKDL